MKTDAFACQQCTCKSFPRRIKRILHLVQYGTLACSVLACLPPLDAPEPLTLATSAAAVSARNTAELAATGHCDPCTIFVTSVNTRPNVSTSGVAGLDALCMTQRPLDAPGAPAGTYRALVMANDASRNLTNKWVLHPSTDYVSASNGNAAIGTTDTQARLPSTLTEPISPTAGSVWTGINATGWTAHPNDTCDSWTWGAGNGRFGIANATDATALDFSNAGCGGLPYFLYCVQQ